MKISTIPFLFILIILNISCQSPPKKKLAEENRKQNTKEIDGLNPFFIGTYTKKEVHVNGKAEGIYLANRKLNGGLELIKTASKITNPSCLRIGPNKEYLYAVNESSKGDTGKIYSFAINKDYSLTELSNLSTEGSAPCYINYNNTGKYVFTVNFFGGVVIWYEKDEQGKLKKHGKLEINKIDPSNNTGDSHPHDVDFSKNNKFLYITDFGNDKIWIFNFDENTGKITPNHIPFVKLEKGSAPRHLVFSSDNKYAYCLNELNNTISTFLCNLKTGDLELIQNITVLPEDFSGKSYSSEIAIHPNGKFLYASNRGHNSLVGFKIKSNSGKLDLMGFYDTQGDFPRHFTINTKGDFLYVANQNTDNILYFKINNKTGELKEQKSYLKVMTPVWIEFL